MSTLVHAENAPVASDTDIIPRIIERPFCCLKWPVDLGQELGTLPGCRDHRALSAAQDLMTRTLQRRHRRLGCLVPHSC